MRPSFPTTVLIATLSLCLAQNNITNSSCSTQDWVDQVPNTSFNSTGTEPFSWNISAARDLSPWYLSVLLNDTAQGRDPSSAPGGVPITARTFLSTGPDTGNSSVCVYYFEPQNATSTGNGANNTGCAGVMSDTCSNHIREAVSYATNSGARPGGPCGSLLNTVTKREKYSEACGEGKLISVGSSKSSPSPILTHHLTAAVSRRIDVSNSSCTYPTLSGVDIPDDYINHETISSLSPYRGIYSSNNATADYDLIVNQAIPFAVSASFLVWENDDASVWQSEVQLVCVTPNNTQQGSRVPENRTPWSSAAGASWRSAGDLSLVVAGMAGFVLAL